MLYATIDYSNKKRFIEKFFIEEVLGELKILMPRIKNEDYVLTSKKILNKIKKYNVQNIVLNKELSKNEKIISNLEENKKYVIDGSRLGKVLLPSILNDVSKYTKVEIEKQKVVLLMNEYSIENMDLIEEISKDVKELVILSKNYKKYERLSNKLFEEYGYSIKLQNENYKEIKRNNIIINIDFLPEDIRKLFLHKCGVIISLNQKINKLPKHFNGIIINDLDIMGNELNKPNFRSLAICEARIYRPLRKIYDNEKTFFAEKYIINGYMGKNGKISVEEFEKVGKNFA